MKRATNLDEYIASGGEEFCEHVGSAKLVETRNRRLDKIIPMILEGIGLSEKYRK